MSTPTSESLQAGLTELLAPARPRVVDRRTAARQSTHPSEVVTCELEDASMCRLLLKYSGIESESFGHRGGVPYEGMVYRDVISRVALPSVRWYGNHHEADCGRTWLVLEFIENARRLSGSKLPLAAGASGIGAFHRIMTSHPRPPRLTRYDARYYAGWAPRALARAERANTAEGWLGSVCHAFAECAAELAAWLPTIIHGEYYAKNVLVVENVVYPVDWESAAVGQGEVDVAALTDAWKPDVVEECEAAYATARWPNGAPPEFQRMLALARIYLHLRWLGVASEWTASRTRRLRRLRDEADRLRLTHPDRRAHSRSRRRDDRPPAAE